MKRIFLSVFILAVVSCGNDPKVTEVTTKDSVSCNNPLNPNGDSELALLMREMVVTTQSIKDSLEKNAQLPSYPEKIGSIFFAKKTDTTLNKELFNGLAENYVRNIKYFYGANQKEKVIAYNGMVNGCVTCHENFCGGPLKRIKKLIIPE
jgi:hypothetical protein